MAEGGAEDGKEFNLFEDKRLTSSVAKLQTRIDSVKDTLDKCFDKDLYTNASASDRVKYDLFLAYATTSLFWAYLRTVGVDPREHPIKREVERIKNYMAKAKTVHDRHLRPVVDQGASKRFVRNALWTPSENENVPHQSKKRKRNPDDTE